MLEIVPISDEKLSLPLVTRSRVYHAGLPKEGVSSKICTPHTHTLTFQIATRLISRNKTNQSRSLVDLLFEFAGTILVVSQCLGESIFLLLRQSPSHFSNSMKMVSLLVCAAWSLSALVSTKKQIFSLPCHCLCIVREQYPYIDKANGQLDQYGNPSMRHNECGSCYPVQSAVWVQIDKRSRM